MDEAKISAIKEACALVIGRTLDRYETAEISHDGSTWDEWPDLPIRFYCTDSIILSISWSKFDELWLRNDATLPFDIEGSKTRWKSNGLNEINRAIGQEIRGVWLGRAELSIGNSDIEVWTRLVFDLGNHWLEVFNALDENGYALHDSMPKGSFHRCA